MKIIEQFVQAVLSIMRLRKSGDHKAAIAQIKTATRCYLKSDLFFLIYCPVDKIFDHFTNSTGEIDTQRCILCGDLLYELALINEEKKQNADPIHLMTLCLNLYSFAIPKEEQFQMSSYFEKVKELETKLKGQSLSQGMEANLKSYQQFLDEFVQKCSSSNKTQEQAK